ncbi:response regulator transcription factor [Streptomyces lucensis]|uniref:response regulator transcription factor n=1 Tax=Streptomyces lucensis TaxID=67319 RepID=UPI0016784316|nr:response regulator transcription factor [Streptomyces lucensis]
MTTHQSAERQRSLVMVSGGGSTFKETAAGLIGNAKYGISVALLHGGPKADAVLEAVAESSRRNEERPAPVAVRFLCGPDMAGVSAVRDLAERIGRAEVRVSEGDLQEALIVDGRTAVTWSSQSSTDESATLVTDPAAAKALDLLFANVWRTGRPTPEHLHIRERLSSEVMRRVLGCLTEGHTDAVAASEMAVSLRTYRRHVAKLMRDIGAESRFQAGVRSVELGLLPRQR